MKTILNIVLFVLFGSLSWAQNSEINLIRTRYFNWLSGANVNYSNPEVMTRYNFIMGGYSGASNLTGFDIANPGTPWNLTNNNDKNQFWSISAKLLELCEIYHITGPAAAPNPHYQETALLNTILSIFDYIQNKGVNSTSALGNYYDTATETYGLGSSVILRTAAYANSILLMRQELLSSGRLNHHLGALDNFTYVWSPENTTYNFTHTGTNADGIKSIGEGRLIYVLCQEDSSPDRLTDMTRYVAFLNNGLKVAPGWTDMIKPDFMTFHHNGAYPSNYGGTSILVASILEWMLHGTNYTLSVEVSRNIREILLAYRNYTLGYNMTSSIAGRFPTNTDMNLPLTYAFSMSYLSDPINNKACGEEFTRLFHLDQTLITNNLVKKRGVEVSLYHTLGGMQLMVDVLNQGLTDTIVTVGTFGYPYAGLSIHKSRNWMVSQKGTNKYVWHYEGNNTDNRLGRFNSAGNMEIYNSTNPMPRYPSGLKWEGWDWSHRPGSTTYSLTKDELIATTANNGDRLFNSKDFLVNSTFGDHGSFGMDYEDLNSSGHLSVKKSSFFFDDYIICMMSDLEHPDLIHQIHTTLFQTALQTPQQTTYLGNTALTGLNYHYSGTQTTNAFTDAANNTFLILSSNDSLHITRNLQQSFAPNGSTPNQGDFTKAWVNHGTNPTNSSLAYCIHINGGVAAVNDLPAQFPTLFEIKSMTDSIHAVHYKSESVYAIHSFYSNPSIHIGPVISLEYPAAVFTKQIDANRLKVGLTDPNLGIYENGESYPGSGLYTWAYFSDPSERTNTVQISDEWILESGPNDLTLNYQNGITSLTFSTKNGKSEECVLMRPTKAGTLSSTSPSHLSIYPNPGNGLFYINFESNQAPVDIQVFDETGNLVHSQNNKSGSKFNIDVRNLKPGYYLVTVSNNETAHFGKIIKY